MTGTWSGQSCWTEPLTCGIWCYLWVESVRIELNYRTPSWHQRIAWWCGKPQKTHTHTGTGTRILACTSWFNLYPFPLFDSQMHGLWALYQETCGTSLAVQWLRIRLPMQGTRVHPLVREDPTCHGATKPVRHNYWACVLQLLKPAHLEPVLRNKRSHCSEKPVHHNEESPLLAATRESPRAATKTQRSQKTKTKKLKKKETCWCSTVPDT